MQIAAAALQSLLLSICTSMAHELCALQNSTEKVFRRELVIKITVGFAWKTTKPHALHISISKTPISTSLLEFHLRFKNLGYIL